MSVFAFMVFFFGSVLLPGSVRAEVEQFQFEWSREPPLEVWVNRLNALNADQKLPVLILFGGFDSGAKVAEMVETREPLMVVSFQYPYQLKENMSFLDKVAEAPQMRQGILSMNEAIGALLKMLAQRRDVARDKISIVGGSFGSPFTINAFTQYKELKALILIHGFMDIQKTIEHQLYRHWKKTWPASIARVFSFLSSHILTWYIGYPSLEKKVSELRPSQKIFVVVAGKDRFIPQEVTASMLEVLKRSSAQVSQQVIHGDHVLRPGTVHTKKVTTLIVQWLKKNQLL